MFRLAGSAVVLAVACVMGRAAFADFRVSTTTSDPGVVADTPHVSPGDQMDDRALRRSPASRRLAARSLSTDTGPAKKTSGNLVQGFGAAVPLEFACKQIVPATVHVSYGSGVDTQTPVNWLGGRPWGAVLRDALAPAGLTIVLRGTTIEIRN